MDAVHEFVSSRSQRWQTGNHIPLHNPALDPSEKASNGFRHISRCLIRVSKLPLMLLITLVILIPALFTLVVVNVSFILGPDHLFEELVADAVQNRVIVTSLTARMMSLL